MHEPDYSPDENTVADGSIVPELGAEGQARPMLTVLTGLDSGKAIPLGRGSSVLGRSPSVTVTLDDDSVSRRHCRIEVPALGAPTILDMGSTNGTSVNGDRVPPGGTLLQEGDKIQLSASVVLKFGWKDDLEEAVQRRLYHSAVRDALTGTYNKRYFIDRLATEFAWACRNARQLACLVFDLDHFKRINDTWGHAAGDVVLRSIAGRVQRLVRTEDVLCRFGGEEFVILMRETTPSVAAEVAERIRKQVACAPVTWSGQDIPVTLSAGLATSDEPGLETGQDLFMLADGRLYEAKATGRNRVVGIPLHP
ncbi:MAG: GGDEF domain-containing protein [Myxococcota bacterium]|nr:GGDEF domain-containing protein [Myxococcota bacterium]